MLKRLQDFFDEMEESVRVCLLSGFLEQSNLPLIERHCRGTVSSEWLNSSRFSIPMVL